jgi:hypothetical protein
MSRKWKMAMGVIVAAVVIAGVALAVWGAVTLRSRVYEHGWGPGEWRTEAATELEVRLMDDDGDGIPDRGVIKVPADLPFGRGFTPGRRLPVGPGHGFDFGRGFGPHFGRGFGPFLFVGGLFRLAFLALLIGLAVACFRRWSRAKVACFRRWSRAKETREPQQS